jgi:hypothetical protein
MNGCAVVHVPWRRGKEFKWTLLRKCLLSLSFSPFPFLSKHARALASDGEVVADNTIIIIIMPIIIILKYMRYANCK